MTYVYILSDHEEHGAENVTATLDRSKLLDLVTTENWPDATPDWISRGKRGLAELLKLPDEELVHDYGNNCHEGWGGMQLHVVELK